jgi:hypothetical protein
MTTSECLQQVLAAKGTRKDLSFGHIELDQRQEFGLKIYQMLIDAGYKAQCLYSYYFVEIRLQ